MNQALSFLSCLWQDYDESKLDIIAALPFELAVMVLRLLDPRALVAAILVSHRWLRLIRHDAVLRRRVYDELSRERRAYLAAVQGRGADKLSVEYLKRLMKRRQAQAETVRELKPRTLRREQAQGIKGPVQLQERPLRVGATLATSSPRILPSKVGKIKPRRKDVRRANPLRSTCIRV